MKPEIKNKFKELLDFAKSNGLVEVAWQEGNKKIAFRRNGIVPADDKKGKSQTLVPVSKEPEPEFVVSPVVGTFRRAGAKNRPPMVVQGDRIRPGSKVGVVECMKIPNDVVSFAAGKIVKILVEDGQAVEYGQPLFAVLANAHINGKAKS